MTNRQIIDISDDSYVYNYSNEIIIISSEDQDVREIDQVNDDTNTIKEREIRSSFSTENLIQRNASSPIITDGQQSQKPMIIYDETIDSSFDVSVLNEEKDKEKCISPKKPLNSQIKSPSKTNVKQKNLLDLSNWISESEEDLTISRLISTPHTKDSSVPTFLKSENILVSLSNSKGSKKLFVDSDPISESSSSPFKINTRDSITNKEVIRPSLNKKEPVKSNIPANISDKYIQNYSQKDLKNVNRVTRTKEELLSEMIIQVPNHLLNKFGDLMNESYISGPHIDSTNEIIPLISWKRKINAEYDAITDTFIPCVPKQKKERNLVLYYEAEDFISQLFDQSFEDTIESAKMQARLDNDNIVYDIIVMIEGYDQYLLKIKNAENKKYKTKVLSSMNQFDVKPRKRQKNNDNEIPASSKEIEFIFNEAQLDLGVNFFTVKSPQDAVGWLLSFTYTIAFSLYDKFERNQALANLGTVKSGVDTKTTFIQTVRQFKLMTEPRAEKLYAYYNTLYSIFSTYQNQATLGQDDLKRNIVPPSTDSAMKNLFTSDDANQLIHD